MPELLHLVLFRMRADADAADVRSVLTQLRRFARSLDGVLDAQAGQDVSVEGLAGPYTHAAAVRFADAHARDAYLAHDGHKKIVTRLGALVEETLVVDIERGTLPADADQDAYEPAVAR